MKVRTIAPRDWGFAVEQAGLTGVDITHPWLTRGPRALVLLSALLQGLICRGPRPRAVHAYSAWPAGVMGWVVARWHAVPPVIHEHLSPASRLSRLPFALSVLRDADRVVCPSIPHADHVEALSGRPACVLPNPVILPNRPRALCLGRVCEQKGFDRVVEAARHLPKIDFDIVGDGPDKARLMRIAPANVYFHPAVPKPMAVALMKSAAAVLCPSRHESFGLVAAEAATLGTPVVATGVGEQGEYATHILEQDASAADFALLIHDASRGRPMTHWANLSPFASRMASILSVPTPEQACA